VHSSAHAHCDWQRGKRAECTDFVWMRVQLSQLLFVGRWRLVCSVILCLGVAASGFECPAARARSNIMGTRRLTRYSNEVNKDCFYLKRVLISCEG